MNDLQKLKERLESRLEELEDEFGVNGWDQWDRGERFAFGRVLVWIENLQKKEENTTIKTQL